MSKYQLTIEKESAVGGSHHETLEDLVKYLNERPPEYWEDVTNVTIQVKRKQWVDL